MERRWTLAAVAAALAAAAVAGCGYDGPQMTVGELKAALDAGEDITVVDLRQAEQYRQGHVPGAINISRGSLREHADELARLGERAALICRCGQSALASCRELHRSGIVTTMVTGGMIEWDRAGFPVERGPGRVAP